MSWSSPKTWVFGEFVTAQMLNVNIRDNMNALQQQFGAWAPVPFDASNFLAFGGVGGPTTGIWVVAAGNVQQNQYQAYNGVMLLWSFSCGMTRLTMPTSTLYLRQPAAATLSFATTEQVGRTSYVDSFPAPPVECLCAPAATDLIRIWRLDGNPFTSGSQLGVYFNIFMRMRPN